MTTVYVHTTNLKRDGYEGFHWHCGCGVMRGGYRDEAVCREEGLAHQLTHPSPARGAVRMTTQYQYANIDARKRAVRAAAEEARAYPDGDAVECAELGAMIGFDLAAEKARTMFSNGRLATAMSLRRERELYAFFFGEPQEADEQPE